MGTDSPWEKLKGQIVLGSDAFTQKIRPLLAKRAGLKEIPRVQRFANRPELETALARGKLYSKARRDNAIRVAHLKHGDTLSEIGSLLGLHYTTVSKVINQTRIAK